MWNLRLSETELDHQEASEVLRTLASGWITSGSRTAEFENAFAHFIGVEEAVAVSNGTAALWLALKAHGIGPGDEVLCPALTFVASAAAVIHCGATPVLCDIQSLERPTIDPEDARRRLTPQTRAIIPVHYAGIPCEMDRINVLARSAGLHVVEDAAHAPGSRFRGRACGSFGTGCFSFFGNKNLTTAEGGMVTTNDRALAERMRRLRSHGMTVSSWDRDKGRPPDYDVVEFGYNFRFDDIRAALGLVQLKKLPELNERRRQIAERYVNALAELPVTLPLACAGPDHSLSHHIFPAVFDAAEARHAAERALTAAGIQTSVHYKPIHRFSAFRKLGHSVHLPVTEAFAARELTLPLYPSMTEAHVEAVANTLSHAFLAATASA